MGGGLQKFQVDSMEWWMDSMEWWMDSMEWWMDSIYFPDGFHAFSRWIPYLFQLDSIRQGGWIKGRGEGMVESDAGRRK